MGDHATARSRDGGVTLVLIADPKQAIYAFRGADVYAYLEAAAQRPARARRCAINWRSDQSADRRLRRAVRRRQARSRGDRLPPGPGRRRRTRSPRLSARRSAPPLRVRVVLRDGPGVDADPQRVRASPIGARAHRRATWPPTSSRCCPRTRGSSTARGRRADPARADLRPATSRCSSAPTATAALVRDALDAAGVPAVINGAGSVFATRAGARLAGACSRRSSGRRRPTRAHAAALTPFLGWSRRAGRASPTRSDAWEEVHRRLHDWARILRERGVAALLETITVGEDLPARVLAVARRRAAADRPAPRRPAAACAPRPTSSSGATALRGVAAERDRRGRRDERRRGAQPPARVRRRGGPGADDPPQQGARVPDRLLPVPVGAGLDPRQAAAPVVLPRPGRPATRARSTSALEGPEFERHRDQYTDRAARRGPAARLRRADARPPPGGDLVGGLVGQPQLAARAAAVRPRRGRERRSRSASSTPDGRRRRSRASQKLAGAAPGLHRRRALDARECRARGARRVEPPVDAERRARSTARLDLRWRRTSYSDITAAAHDALGRERARGAVSSSDEPTGRRGRSRPRRSTAPERGQPLALGAMPVGAERRDVRAPRARGDRLRRRRPRRGARAHGSTRRRAGAASSSATRRVVVAGSRAAIETPLGPLLDGLALRDFARARPARRARASSCRWPAATSRTAGLTLSAVAGGARASCCRPAIRWPATRSGSRRPGAAPQRARLSDRQPRPRGPARTGPAAVRGRSTTRRTGSGELDEPLTACRTTGPRRWRPRCSAATTRSRRCCTSSRCTATCAGELPGLRPRRATSPAFSICSCAGWPGDRGAARPACSPGGRRRA